MSDKWLNHDEWIAEQFQDKYLPKNFRNSIIHAALIEGIVRKISGRKNFGQANELLLKNNDISSLEFCDFDIIRDTRNKVVHEIVKNKLSQKDIDKLIRTLRNRLSKVYEESNFLDKHLFKAYNLKPMLNNRH